VIANSSSICLNNSSLTDSAINPAQRRPNGIKAIVSFFFLACAGASRTLVANQPILLHRDTFPLERRHVIQIAVQTDIAKYLVGTMFFGLTWCGPQQVKFGNNK
jgi:hypothetical protein